MLEVGTSSLPSIKPLLRSDSVPLPSPSSSLINPRSNSQISLCKNRSTQSLIMYTSRSPSSSSSTLQSFLLLLFLLLSTSLPTEAYSYGQLKTLMSLSHSLMNRVANLRSERGDYYGSLRARKIAEKLNVGGVGLWKGMWSMGWDYMKNYAWREMSTGEMFRAVSDMKEILKGLNELTQLKSDKERMTWMVRNYQNIFRISKSMLQKLLHVFSRSGPVRELVLILQEEVEGGLLRDCLELGTSDLKGVIQIMKDIALQFSASREHDDL